MTIEHRMLNKKEAMKYMRMSRGQFHSILQKHNYGGVKYYDNGNAVYDIKVLDQILDSFQPSHALNPQLASFESAWKGVVA